MIKHVVYPGHGVAEVVSENESHLLLLVKRSRMKVTLPVAKLASYKLRDISPAELVRSAYLNATQKTEEILKPKKNWNQRQREYNLIVQSGDLLKISEVASRIQKDPSPSFGDKKILQTCINLIQDEAEVVFGQPL